MKLEFHAYETEMRANSYFEVLGEKPPTKN